MKKSKIVYYLSFAVFTVISFLFLPAPSLAQEWKAGVAAEVITPSEPMWTGGYGGRKLPATGKIHDLYVKALALENARGGKVVIVTADLIGYRYDFMDELSKEIEKKLGLPRKSFIFNASHTHCGPDFRPWPAKTVFVDYIPDDYFEKIAPYRKWLQSRFVEVVERSLKNLSPATVSFSSARPVPFAVSRRFPDGKGGVIYRSSPSSYYTEGPRDDIAPVLKVSSPNGKVVAVLFGYACHPITLNLDQYCADYPGFAQQYVQEAFPGATAMFMQGCGGELVPNARFQVEYAMGHGKALADAVIKAVQGPQIALSGPITTGYKETKLNFKPVEKEDLDKQLASPNSGISKKAGFLLEKIARGEKIDLTIPAPLQVISFGPELLLLGFLGETVADYSVNSKKEFADRAGFVWVSGYNNYIFGYLPTLKILREGGYEALEDLRSTPLPISFTEDVEDIVMGGMRELVNSVTR